MGTIKRVDAGNGEDMKRDTAESEREVSELGRDSLGALLPAEQREGREATKMPHLCSKVAALVSF